MSRVCVVTSDAAAYYSIVSRLRKAGVPFESLIPESENRGCQVILTTKQESTRFGDKAFVLEDLDGDPGVFKGQIVSRLAGSKDELVIGVDPGSRIGMAAYYGKTSLAFNTFNSAAPLCSRVGAFVAKVPARKSVVRIGNGNRTLAAKLAETLSEQAPGAVIEIVDESGTSVSRVRMKGILGDEGAAARIAFRKGDVVSPGGPRSHG